MPRRATTSLLGLFLSLLAHAPAAHALAPPRVAGLTALHRDGQTFLTWTTPGDPGWTYRIYRSSAPLTAEEDLVSATLLWAVGDSSALDRRLSTRLGLTLAHTVDSAAGPLAPAQGLYVVTPAANGTAWYAVTSQLTGSGEDRTIQVGANALALGVVESVAAPRPVFQRRMQVWSSMTDFYTLWSSHVDTPDFPAMASRPGMAFDCGVIRGTATTPGSLMIMPHQRGGSLLNGLAPSGEPGEWVLAMDDPLPNGQNSFWFGYHPDYDLIGHANLPPLSGTVVDYTFRRVRYTLDWAMRNFPLDPARVYAFGFSMGGIGSLQLAAWLPGRIAAVMSVAGKYDFSFLADPDPASGFNPGNGLRTTTDRMWGTVATNLPVSRGGASYASLDLGACVRGAGANTVPPIIAIEGKSDLVVGWAEKIGFYDAMRDERRGGAFYWSPADHPTVATGLWSPLVDRRSLHRYRSDRSFPALTNCDIDDDPGDGHFASGDTAGTINGHLEWDTTLEDRADLWGVTLRLRDLPTRFGTRAAPESCRVDVTPARLQVFTPVVGQPLTYRVMRLPDLATVRVGAVWPDRFARVTIPGVSVYRTGTRLWLGPGSGVLLDAPRPAPPGPLTLFALSHPIRGRGVLLVRGASVEQAEVELFDVGGRRVWREAAFPATGARERRVELPALPSGVYLARATTPGSRASLRFVVID
jgi:hypothetical protein